MRVTRVERGKGIYDSLALAPRVALERWAGGDPYNCRYARSGEQNFQMQLWLKIKVNGPIFVPAPTEAITIWKRTSPDRPDQLLAVPDVPAKTLVPIPYDPIF
jgi:hypothetical protein